MDCLASFPKIREGWDDGCPEIMNHGDFCAPAHKSREASHSIQAKCYKVGIKRNYATR